MNAQAAYVIATSRQRELIHEAAEHRRGRLARQSRDQRHSHAHARVSMAAVAAVLLALTAVAF